MLSDTLGTSSPDALGGTGTARRLNGLLGRANHFLDLAEAGAKVKGNLGKARRQLKAFEKTVQRGLRRKRAAIDRKLGEFILGLARGRDERRRRGAGGAPLGPPKVHRPKVAGAHLPQRRCRAFGGYVQGVRAQIGFLQVPSARR